MERRTMRRRAFISLFLIFVMIFSLCVSAFAIEDEDIRETDNPLIVFDNLREPQPDLYVMKTVSESLEGYYAPADAEFEFQLRWDEDDDGYLENCGDHWYTLYDKTGVAIGEYKTDKNGYFTLKDGQYAYFEFFGQHKYEITEVSRDNFIQITPAGDESASGTVDAEGTIVEFENMYIPTRTDSEETMLAVRKEMVFPDGFEEATVNEDFEFTIKIDGSLYKNQPYTIYNGDMTEELDRGQTDSEGVFTVPMNCTAVFDEIEVGVDYEVWENDCPDGWRIYGTTEYHGSTTAPIVYAYFTNEPSYLIVEKQRTDGITGLDNEFTFVLSDDSDNLIADMDYYVYDTNGNLIGSGTTDENGEFTLKAGERALFMGIEDGTTCYITEQKYEGYNVDDVVEETASYGNDKIAVIQNEQLTDITIKKLTNSDKLLGGATFAVYKYLGDEEIDSVPDDIAENEDFQYITEGTTVSDEDDENFGTYTFKNLQPGTYVIYETEAPEGYYASKIPVIITLPYTMTEEEIVDGKVNVDSENFRGLWSDQDNCYYFYDITYDVYNNKIVFEMPNTASSPIWPYVVGGIVILLICFGIAFAYDKKKKQKVKDVAKS